MFQRGKDFVPFILEENASGVWGDLRQISLDESYSLGHMDGDSNSVCSQMIYMRDTNLDEWLVGHWRCNEGTNVSVSDSSNQASHSSPRRSPPPGLLLTDIAVCAEHTSRLSFISTMS